MIQRFPRPTAPQTRHASRNPDLWLSAAAMAAALLAWGPQGAAAATFTPPEGCTLELTVQSRGCSVTQYYRCSTDAEGDQRSAVFGQGGTLRSLARIDSETRWMESSNPETGVTDLLEEDARDHASFSALLRTGRDDFDFWTRSNGGERLHHVGQDVLTGEKVTIDGVELDKTRFRLTTRSESGEVVITREGQQFISRSMRRFFGGVETQSDWTGENRKTDDSPVLFQFPGEPGFGSTEPRFDCGQLLTELVTERAQL